ncbi:MAG: signal recognition particle-docking protein FtsY [Brevundimonas sp.]
MTDAPKKGWLSRLTEGLSRSSRQMTDQVVSAFVKEPLGEAALEGLEEHLLESDLGPAATDRIVARFRELRFGPNPSEMEVKTALAEARPAVHRLPDGPTARRPRPRPFVTLFVGVNGSGKTTTLGKIAADLTGRGAKVMIVAGDTFRAAAREQLKVWAERAGAHFESRRDGADAAGLAYDAFVKAKAEGFDVVLIDTAGRLQNKSALMDELLKIVRVLKKVDPEAPHETLLVLDATVGRNALEQEKIFGRTAYVSGLVMTKLDGTARGGVLVPVAQASDAPIKLIGVGEGIEDLQPFDARAFARSLMGLPAEDAR